MKQHLQQKQHRWWWRNDDNDVDTTTTTTTTTNTTMKTQWRRQRRRNDKYDADDDDKENVDDFNHYDENEDTKSKETVKDLVIETALPRKIEWCISWKSSQRRKRSKLRK